MDAFIHKLSGQRRCVIAAIVVLLAFAGFSGVMQFGGYLAVIIIYALSIGLMTLYMLQEPLRTRGRIRERTMVLQNLAYRDALTGLPNRRFFNWYIDHHLARELNSQENKNLHSRIVLFDLNGFKLVNDTYGHDAGDRLLTHLSDALTAYLPTDTLLARLGGDEFVVLVRDYPNGNKIQDVVQIIRLITSSTLHLNQQRIQVSASIGVSSAVPGKPSTNQLLREADKLMYLEKESCYG